MIHLRLGLWGEFGVGDSLVRRWEQRAVTVGNRSNRQLAGSESVWRLNGRSDKYPVSGLLTVVDGCVGSSSELFSVHGLLRVQYRGTKLCAWLCAYEKPGQKFREPSS